jgi:lysophospholipase L1-like esterase
VLWIGDSVAADLAPAVMAAVGAAGATVVDGSIDGARFTEEGTVRPKPLYTRMLAEHPSDLVVVQMTLWDSEAPTEAMRAGITWFRDLVLWSGADLVFVTPPPVRPDLIRAGLADQLAIVRELADAEPTRIHVIDSSALWGPTMERDMDGDSVPDRKPDGVHVCPQGAARYAAWLVDQLAGTVDGLTPVFPSAWLGGTWAASIRYDTPVGACVALAG